MWVSGASRRSSAATRSPEPPGIERSSTATSGRRRSRELQRLGAGRGLADHGEPGLSLQHVADAGSNDGVVVGDQHADDGLAHDRATPSTGTLTSTSAPPPSAPCARTLPPSAPMRSRMPARPMWPRRSYASTGPGGNPRPSSRTSKQDASAARREADLHGGRARVAGHVGQRLLQRAEQGQLRLARKSGGSAAGAENVAPDGAPLGELGRQRAQGRQQARGRRAARDGGRW